VKISINVPTYLRAGMVDTFKILPSVSYWVHEFEVDTYKKTYPKMKIRILPDEIRGNVARVRNFILEKTKADDVSVQIDDDVHYLFYFEQCERYHVKKQAEIVKFIENMSIIADGFGAKLWGINVAPDKQCYREYTPFSTLSYVSASFSCFLKGNELRYDERFSLKEDYDMLIQQVNRYRRVFRVNKWFYHKKGAQQTGGCAAYRNVEREIGQIEALQRKWGKRIVQFDNVPRNHLSKKQRNFDINPVIRIPIGGV
jgi:hypothetical protein